MKANVRIAVDTNIILRLTNEQDPLHVAIDARLDELSKAGWDLCFAAQNLYEYWAVATRPVEANGYGVLPAEAAEKAQSLLHLFRLLRDPPQLLYRWMSVCNTVGIRGRQSHDARLAVWMLGNRIKRLLTLNPGDFKRFSEIQLINPQPGTEIA